MHMLGNFGYKKTFKLQLPNFAQWWAWNSPVKYGQVQMGQYIRFCYLTPRQPGKTRMSLHIHAVFSEPLLLPHRKRGHRSLLSPKFKSLDPLGSCTCHFRKSENQIMARVYVRSITRSTMYQKAPFC